MDLTEDLERTESLEPVPVPDVLEWEVRFWKGQESRRPVVLLMAAVAAMVGLQLFRSVALAGVAVATILVSTSELWLPVRYRLDAKGATRRCGLSTTQLEWPDLKRVLWLDGQVRLSPLAQPSRLDEFRGVLLVVQNNEEEIRAFIEQHWQRPS